MSNQSQPPVSLTRRGLLGGVLGLAFAAAGCGGGSSAFRTGSPGSGSKGRAIMTIVWPAIQTSRLIPQASAAIKIVILDTDGKTVVASQVVARASAQGTPPTSTVVLGPLPTGTLTVTATAYPDSGAQGTPQAFGSAPLTITAGQQTAITLTMDSTIATLEVSPSPISLPRGVSLKFTATARDSNGNVVLMSSQLLHWESLNTGLATVDQSGLVTILDNATYTDVTIKVTDTESNKSGTVIITIDPSASLPISDSPFLWVSATVPGVGSNSFTLVSPSDSLQQTLALPPPPDYNQRDFVIDASGKLHVYSGTFIPNLITYDPATNSWDSRTAKGWSTANVTYYGGIGSLGAFIFVTSETTGQSGLSGLFRFDFNANTSQRFAAGNDYRQLTIGWDGLLYAVRDIGEPDYPGSNIDVFDPTTLALQRTVVLPIGVSDIAVAANGDMFGAPRDIYDFPNNTCIHHFDATGKILKVSPPTGTWLLNIALSRNGYIACGGNNGVIYLSDKGLASLSSSFDTKLWWPFVEFNEPTL